MTNGLKAFLYGVATVLLAALACLLFWNRGVKTGRARQLAEDEASFKPDTVYVIDTLILETPPPKSVRVVDTFYVEVPKDTAKNHGTQLLALPVERKIYEDSFYRAVVSGVQASLDSITIYKTMQRITNRVTQTVPRPFQPNSIYVNLEATYDSRFLLPLTAGYTRHWENGFYVGGGGGYDPLTKSPVVEFKGGFNFRW